MNDVDKKIQNIVCYISNFPELKRAIDESKLDDLLHMMEAQWVTENGPLLARVAYWYAAAQGRLAVMCVLLDKGYVHINQKDDDDNHALHFAAYAGHLPVVEFFISRGLNISPEAFVGGKEGSRADWLREDGVVIINAPNKAGQTAETCAALQDHEDVVGAFNAIPGFMAAWFKLANAVEGERGAKELVSYLDEHHNRYRVLLLGARNVLGETALHIVLAKGCREAAHELIEAGAPVNVSDYRLSRMPLHLAAAANDMKTCELLLEHGASVDAMLTYDIAAGEVNGNTPLHEAARVGAEPALIRLLLRHHASKEKKNGWRKTPQQLAVRHPEIYPLLTPNGGEEPRVAGGLDAPAAMYAPSAADEAGARAAQAPRQSDPSAM